MMDLISSIRSPDFLVSGFFTPNYLDYAKDFAANLSAREIPFHLYAVGEAEWRNAIRYKPTCIARCRADYPTAIVVNMDVDCRVRGPIREALTVKGDVGVRFAGRFRKNRPVFYPSTRVSVWNPTPGAERLCAGWRALCESDHTTRNDEALLMQAISNSENISVTPFNPLYGGAELNTEWCAANAVIVHQSIHDGHPAWQMRTKHLIRDWRHGMFKALTGRSYTAWKYGD